MSTPLLTLDRVQHEMERVYVGVAGAHLRDEDRRKAHQVLAMLHEVARALRGRSRSRSLTLVDAASGKSYLGLLALRLVVEPLGFSAARLVTIERDADRVEASRLAAECIGAASPIDCRLGELSDHRLWPDRPALVMALHACGTAADDVIAHTVAVRAHTLLLVPCCTSAATIAATHTAHWLDIVGIPAQAPVRVRFTQALVDADRTWRLEAAGYETRVVEFVGATTTPHNLLWRARRVGEPGRMADAVRRHARLRSATP